MVKLINYSYSIYTPFFFSEDLLLTLYLCKATLRKRTTIQERKQIYSIKRQYEDVPAQQCKYKNNKILCHKTVSSGEICQK